MSTQLQFDEIDLDVESIYLELMMSGSDGGVGGVIYSVVRK